jgi:predicted amidohydrolase YtcJ
MSVSAKRWQTIVWIGLLATLLVPAASRPQAPKNDFILYGGDVVTMDKKGTLAEAVWVRDGKIEAVGPREEVMRHKTETTELVDLHDGALLPGFVEPHLHLDAVAAVSFLTDLTPCLPVRYETRKRCPLTIFKALKTLKEGPTKPPGSAWIVGFGIDPSRMSLDGTRPSSVFHANPARYIEQRVSATRPVIIFDDSGHLAYTNRQAFVAVGLCKEVKNCGPNTVPKSDLPASPGKWIAKDGLFTGLLQEEPAFVAFVKVIPPQTPQQTTDRAEAEARDFARAGVTTMANGGTGTLELFQTLAAKSPAHPLLRYRALVPWNAVPPGLTKPSPWDESNGGLFGVTGIKLVADGSDQGCTGALIDPYNEHGPCSAAIVGPPPPADYTLPQVIDNLRPFWKAGWPIQIHVNGDAAILMALNALATLQLETRNDSPITLLHFTIDGNPATGEDMVKRVADLRAGRFEGKPVPPVDVRVSHLIGHVAYWGGAFENILDGVKGPEQPDENGRAARIDATRRDLELGVPFSLHSDNPVTPTHPLWYVEQAVTRNTWFYPKLKDTERHTMPGGQNITIAQALEAVTIEPASQHGLERYIGSIEKGKVADLVILDKNPLKQPPNEIHRIRVLSTFVGGYRNDWSKE